MMKPGTLILHVAARFLVPLQMLFSIFLLLRGHDEPGGGFIAGLVASGALALYLFTFGAMMTRDLMRVDPRNLIGLGLVIAMLSTLPGWAQNEPFLTAQWWPMTLPGGTELKLSTPLIFDIGVYLTVLGTVMTMLVALTETEER
ncbi:Na+/H+ antiporter subunit B [Nitrincola tapanii]|jgi:multicomponent Na+:H+ antiporter subunit B|uniref:Na+/H+ antiporter subunit B n=1 Tax=Nitrincola tapanii TaxID=1708751 RepID=A0A5A9W156_9GAMM|nr:Na+/H+ antiporter subunit B [Nitrincola tapanii]KAA0874214.1 Na+/H+ antiporter subunit B [Nitrincola tapanii]